MSTKEISGFLTIVPADETTEPKQIALEVQTGNVAFRHVSLRRADTFWNYNWEQSLYIAVQPWKSGGFLADTDDLLGHSVIGYNSTNIQYPYAWTANTIDSFDYRKFRAAKTTAGRISTDLPQVFGSVVAWDGTPGSTPYWGADRILSLNDVPTEYTQIGNVYQHPMVVGGSDISTVAGASYITYANGHFLDTWMAESHTFNLLRIGSGADAGMYRIRFSDSANNRLYLTNLDGSLFVGQATASSLPWYAGPGRRAYFNEVSIIQQSTGSVVVGGTFRPGATRTSFIARAIFDKTGSDASAAGTEQQGSYYVTLTPYTHGTGVAGSGNDTGSLWQSGMWSYGSTPVSDSKMNFFDGGCNGMVLDEANQRLWFGMSTRLSPLSGIGFWRWRTNEHFREVANHTNTPVSASLVTPAITLAAGDVIQDMRRGAAGFIYTTLSHASGGNAGLIVINGNGNPPFATLQYTTGSGFPAITAGGSALDETRARTGTSVSTDGSNNVTCATGAFAAADIGRAIKLTGLGADNGTYKISTIGGATTVGVTTLADAAVTFTSQSGGSFEIGERLYLFFSSGATGSGKINYMESMAMGTFLTRTVAMTAGASVNLPQLPGGGCKVDLDAANGNVYWLSNDSQQQINKYEVSTNTHSFLTIANVSSPPGQTGTVTTITAFTSIFVSTKFDEIWVGTDAGGIVKLVKSTFASGTVKRYIGSEATTYANPAGFFRPGGYASTQANLYVHSINERPDGRIGVMLWTIGATSDITYGHYLRESDLFLYNMDRGTYDGNLWTSVPRLVFDSAGNGIYLCPSKRFYAGNNSEHFGVFGGEVQYQWDIGNSQWIPLEVAQRGLPNKGSADTRTDGATTALSATFTGSGFIAADVGKYLQLQTGTTKGIFRISTFTSATSVDLVLLNGAPFVAAATAGTLSYSVTDSTMSKPIHAGLEDVLYGVKLGFTKQGGATPANNEFLGYAGQTTVTKTDGATNTGTPTLFSGSGFVSGDVGRLLRLETGADAGIYKITVFNSGTSITVTKLNGTSFSPSATAASLQYTIWSLGTAGANAGPENASLMLADGFGKDNTQDISGVSYETYYFKTLLQEQVEGTKFCVPNPIGVPGGQGMKVYYDFFPRVGSAQLSCHNLQTTHARALPGAEWTSGGFDGSKLVDGFLDTYLDNTGGHGNMHSSPSNANIWYGTLPVSSALGCCPMVDLGANAEVGYIIVRGYTVSTSLGLAFTATNHGLRATIYKANGPTTPVASSVARLSGSGNLTLVLNNTTVTLASGDFLGAVTTGPFSNGTVTALGNTFTAPAATFVPGDVGKLLKITSVGDVGAYRITAVDGPGAVVTVRGLDQTTTSWTSSTSGIVYEVRDGVREEDVLCVPSIVAPVQRLTVERLLTATTAQVRVPPHTGAASQNWEAAVPTWDKVKRISYSTEAVPPEVKANGTWVCEDGRERYASNDFKIYADLTDLSAAQRTGRWWQMQMMPRFDGNSVSGDFWLGTFEFYSPAGVRLGVSQNTWSDTALQNADFLTQHINRLDFIQGAYNAMAGTSNVNGLVNLGGANGDTLTLTTPTDKFLGHQVRRPYADGVSVAGAGGNFTSATAAFISSDVGRTLWIQGGADAGYYRIVTRVSATAITVMPVSGVGSTSFTGATGNAFSIHSGFSVGGVSPDRIVFLDDLTREYRLASINDAMDTITIMEARQTAKVGKQWEIRRPAFYSGASAVDSTKLGRLLEAAAVYPLQSGDVVHDSRGALRFWADDIGTGNSRADGGLAGGNKVFTGTGFCADDVGRLLYVTGSFTAANNGIYKIVTFTSSTSVTVDSAYPGGSIANFTADAGPLTYKVYGDCRFKITKQVTTLRA